MTVKRAWAKGVKLSEELWWIVGGYSGSGGVQRSTEIYNATSGLFSSYIALPISMNYHNIFNINETHVALISPQETDNIYIFDRLILKF